MKALYWYQDDELVLSEVEKETLPSTPAYTPTLHVEEDDDDYDDDDDDDAHYHH
jgi:hypothetical protein